MHVEVAQHASENEAANVLITNVADKVACIVEESEKVVVSAIFNELYAANTLDTEEVKVAVPTSKEKPKHSSSQFRQPLGAVVMMDGEGTLMK
ncbi:hypothetical protein V6N11_019560 [Hibiscus sabdariffa]|uniref:Uncharacterized protein n=1 Tax=Hibiscus sabdariffa TaxID=183260 RepID=A0ABR1ZT00_9ROSI